jgi:glycosyltransferase involved in cell wall biosynthesis
MAATPLVSVLCITYNHRSYIAQCLDGILNQQTRYPFEIIVYDDASTDGTSDIIREYERKFPGIVKPILQSENQYSKGIRTIIASFMLSVAQGKYLAICEGDDYWTDRKKLEHQIALLESDLEIGVCYSRAKKYNQRNGKLGMIWGGPATRFTELIEGNVIPTLTTVFRKELYTRYIAEVRPQDKQWAMGDYPTWLWFALKSKIFFSKEVTAVYRVLEESMSHAKNIERKENFIKSTNDIIKYFCNFTKTYVDIKKVNNQLYLNLAINAMLNERYSLANEYCSFVKEDEGKQRVKKIIIKTTMLRNIYRFYLLNILG